MIHSHQSIYSGGAHVKQSFFICNTFQAVYEDSIIMLRMLQSSVLQNSRLNFKSTKQENVVCFINTKGTSIHANEIKLKNLRVNLRIFKVFSTFIKTARWKMPLSMTHRNQVNQFANPSKFR